MKRLNVMVFCVFVFQLAVYNVSGQKRNTIHTGNERLIEVVEGLLRQHKSLQAASALDTFFVHKMKAKIDSIHTRALERRIFVNQLNRVNGSIMPTTFKCFEFESLNNRLIKESKPLASDLRYSIMLKDLLNLTEEFDKSKKVYYARGKYRIPEKILPKATEVYAPLFESIIHWMNKYREFDFDVVIKTIGFSDGVRVDKGSSLYKDMQNKMQENNISTAEIHSYLSYLRSYDVADVLEKLWQKNKHRVPTKNNHIQFVKTGGAFNYTELEVLEDRKKRAVHVSYYILPKF